MAREPGVLAGVKRADTARLNVLVERIRAEVGASYIVIGDKDARRLVHPNADRIGQPMMGMIRSGRCRGSLHLPRARVTRGLGARQEPHPR